MKSTLPSCLAGLLVAALCMINSGCATVTRGTKDTLVIESNPAGATVRLSNGMTGKTPTSFKLPRKDSLVVTIEKEGYETLTVNVNSQVSGAGAVGMAGNVLVGGLVGAVIDPLSGAMKDLRPNPVKVTLVPARKSEPSISLAASPAPAPVEAPPAAPSVAATEVHDEASTQSTAVARTPTSAQTEPESDVSAPQAR